ncbi:MAG: 3'-5' exoribonuclease YhaM family protein [Solirubrobacteraceae bacterium]
MQVRQLQVGASVAMPLLVREARARSLREGGELLKLTLGDRTGCLPAVVLEEIEEAREICRAGAVVFVVGSLVSHELHGTRLEVETVRAAGEAEYQRHQLIDGPARPAGALEADLRELVATVQNADLRRLLAALVGEDTEVWGRFREAPAAKHYHQAYRHGLLEHSLTVAQAVSAISATFPGIDRDVAVTGALLHDIGKLDAYAMGGGVIEMTDQGRLYGEIALGYYLIRNTIERLEGFPADTAQALLHIILSHHGSLEHGSPVIPCTREATLVHMADNLGGKLGSFDRVEKALPAGAQWSSYDKGIGGGAFFAAPPMPERRAA